MDANFVMPWVNDGHVVAARRIHRLEEPMVRHVGRNKHVGACGHRPPDQVLPSML